VTTRFARTDFHRRAVALLDQQLWCWGRDVARPAGNILLGLGMCRYRSNEPGPDRTAYTGRVAGDGVVWLWGFGMVYYLPGRGGVFLRRNGFDPVLVTEPDRPVHLPEHLGPFVRPATARHRGVVRELVRDAAMWIAGYEHWVAENLGTAYRAATLAARDKTSAFPAREMARAWEHLAKKSVRLSDPEPSQLGPWAHLHAVLRAPSETPSPRSNDRYGPNTHKRFSHP
jgi:hypothetical protein